MEVALPRISDTVLDSDQQFGGLRKVASYAITLCIESSPERISEMFVERIS